MCLYLVRSDDDFEAESKYNLKRFLVLFITYILGLHDANVRSCLLIFSFSSSVHND